MGEHRLACGPSHLSNTADIVGGCDCDEFDMPFPLSLALLLPISNSRRSINLLGLQGENVEEAASAMPDARPEEGGEEDCLRTVSIPSVCHFLPRMDDVTVGQTERHFIKLVLGEACQLACGKGGKIASTLNVCSKVILKI